MPDYIFMLESRLSPEQLQVLNQLQQDAQELSLNLYVVGGAVRDLMTGSPIRDLDFVVEGNPLRLVRRLEAGGVRRVEIDVGQRSAELVLAEGVSLSLEMARNQFFQAPGRPPQVSPAPILEDLRRRDFSANAMGISLTPGSRGLLLDPTNGLADIANRELRVLHNYSFVHDPLRLFRQVRFCSRLGFRPEARTRELFTTALERGYQSYIQPAALGRELEQIAREANAVAVLKQLAEHQLLAVLHPLLQKRKPDYEGLAKLQKYRQHAVEAGYRLDPFRLVLHYLLRRLKPRVQKQFFRKLGLKTAEVKGVLGLAKEARQLVALLQRGRALSPRQVYRLLTPIAVELLVFVLAEFSARKKIQAKIYNYLFKYRPLHNRLPVRELQLMGVPPGPKFDQILEEYFEAQLDGKLRGRAQQLRFLRKLAGVPKPSPKREKKKERVKKAPPPSAGAEPRRPAPGERKPPKEIVAPPETAEEAPARPPAATAPEKKPTPQPENRPAGKGTGSGTKPKGKKKSKSR